MRLGVAQALVDGEWVGGDVEIGDGGRIVAVGVRPAGQRHRAAPGFVDLQVNGFAGVDFLTAGPDDYERAGRALAATGVTSYQPTFITSPPEVYQRALGVAGRLPAVTSGGPRLLGVHLEGPFLAPEYHGAHSRDHLVDPDSDLAATLLDWGPVSYVTLAPELPGAIGLIGELVGRRVVVALGHSGASAAEAHAGFDAGATTVTHIFNAMGPFGHREPGLAGVALAREDVVVQAIVDHVHLAPDTTRLAWLAARGRFALVTDAMAAARLGDGRHRLGDREVDARGDEVRLADGTLAGSVLTMDRAVRNLVELGVPLEEALRAASAVPAGVVRRTDIGHLHPGGPADVVVLDDDLAPVRTLVDGTETFAR